MSANTHASESIAKLVPGGGTSLAHLSDDELHANTRCLVGTSNRVFAALLLHLAEVEARGIHRTRACASLYTYCIYELRFSEDAAARRAGAAKLVKRFPALVEAIANGELHLTGLLMLGPHLNDHNLSEVLGRAKFRTKKELSKLVRELHPLPLVADSIEPLRPESKAPRNPSWQDYVSSLAPPVRELPSGERPADWLKNEPEFGVADGVNAIAVPVAALTLHAPARVGSRHAASLPAPVGVEVPVEMATPSHAPLSGELSEATPLAAPAQVGLQHTPSLLATAQVEAPTSRHVPARRELSDASPSHLPAPLELPNTTPLNTPGVVDLSNATPLDATALVELPDATPLDATALVELPDATPLDATARVNPRAAVARPQERGESARTAAPLQYHMQFTTTEEHVQLVERAKALLATRAGGKSLSELHVRAMRLLVTELEKQRFGAADLSRRAPACAEAGANDAERTSKSARARYIPASVRRAVFERDEARCTYVDERGERCREIRYLELHHRQAFGKGGPNTVANLTLHCAAHNALAAELDFGHEHMEEQRAGADHEPLSSQESQLSRCIGFEG